MQSVETVAQTLGGTNSTRKWPRSGAYFASAVAIPYRIHLSFSSPPGSVQEITELAYLLPGESPGVDHSHSMSMQYSGGMLKGETW